MDYFLINHIHWFRARFKQEESQAVILNTQFNNLQKEFSYSQNIHFEVSYEMLIGMGSGGITFCFACN